MDLYIDKENLISLIHQIKYFSNQDTVADCLRMIRKQLRVIYNFGKEEINEQLYQLWFNNLVQGRGNKEETDKICQPPFPKRPLSFSYLDETNWRTISSVFLCTDINSKDIRQEYRLLFSNENEEILTLKRLFWGDYEFSKKYDLTQSSISFGWKELSADGHCLPCSDIMVVDRYLLSNHNNIGNNLLPLLKRLTINVKGSVNIVLLKFRK